MSSSDTLSLRPPPPPRKPSEAKSVDSGYDGPSRETSAVLLPNSDLVSRNPEKEASQMLCEQPSIPHRFSSSLTGIIESSVDPETRDSCSILPAGEERDAVTFEDSGSPDPEGAAFSCSGGEGFRCKSEPYLLSTEEESTLASLTHSSSANPNITTPSQPSVVQFSQNPSSISVMLSSSNSIKDLKITIAISSPESQTQPSTGCQSAILSERYSSMTAEQEEILKKTVKKNINLFIDQTHFDTLIPFLFQKKLIHTGDSETLESIASHKTKGNHFYTVMLPRKGKRAYRRLYKCLSRETEHLGHQDLVVLLDRALRDQQNPPSSSDSSPADEDCYTDRNYNHLLSVCSSGPPAACCQNCQESCSSDTLTSLIGTGSGGLSRTQNSTSNENKYTSTCSSDFPQNTSSCRGDGTSHSDGCTIETTSRDDRLKIDEQANDFGRGNVVSRRNESSATNRCCTLL